MASAEPKDNDYLDRLPFPLFPRHYHYKMQRGIGMSSTGCNAHTMPKQPESCLSRTMLPYHMYSNMLSLILHLGHQLRAHETRSSSHETAGPGEHHHSAKDLQVRVPAILMRD